MKPCGQEVGKQSMLSVDLQSMSSVGSLCCQQDTYPIVCVCLMNGLFSLLIEMSHLHLFLLPTTFSWTENLFLRPKIGVEEIYYNLFKCSCNTNTFLSVTCIWAQESFIVSFFCEKLHSIYRYSSKLFPFLYTYENHTLLASQAEIICVQQQPLKACWNKRNIMITLDSWKYICLYNLIYSIQLLKSHRIRNKETSQLSLQLPKLVFAKHWNTRYI